MIPTEWLEQQARRRPAAPALRDEQGRALTYGQLYERALPVAQRLAAGRRAVLIELEPGLEHAIAVHAAVMAGISFQTLRPGLPAPEREDAIAGYEGAVPFDPGWLEADLSHPAGFGSPPPADHTLCRILTSGSSGARKPVYLSYANHYASAGASAFNLGVRSDDRWLCCMPVDHVGGLSILVRSLIYGTAAAIHPGFDTARVAAELSGDVTMISLVPTQLRRLLDADAPLHRARLILLGGAPAPAELLAEALQRDVPVVQTYGLTEACSQVSTLALADARRRLGSAGRPLPGTEVEIEAGEILVRGPTVAAHAADEGGWLRTGDRGRLDRDGFLWVDGRRDDLIVSGGENVAPEEVERVLLEHPAVSEAAVVGRPDPEWGEAVTAFVVPAPGGHFDPVELKHHCAASLASFKVPKRFERRELLPRTPSGKLLRRSLR